MRTFLTNKWATIFIDTVVIGVSVFLAFFLRFEFSINEFDATEILYVIVSELIFTLLCFHYFKIYKRVWQYAGFDDFLVIGKSVVYSTVLFIVLHHLIFYTTLTDLFVPRSIYVIAAMMIILGVGGVRFAQGRLLSTVSRTNQKLTRCLIVGAGDAGSLIARELKYSRNSELNPVAFVDDNPYKKKQEIYGIPILGQREDIPNIVASLNVRQIIIALPSADKSSIAGILDICKKTGCQIKILPQINDLVNGKITLSMFRNVSVEDLLGREPVKVNLEEVAGYLEGKTVLVTGAGGSIGSELSRQISKYAPSKVLLLGHGENSIYDIELELKGNRSITYIPVIADIQDKSRINEVFLQHKPDVVFHAAAHKHVPLMEANPLEAIKNNVFGTKNLAECAHVHGVERFVMISTDKAVNPTNIMGASKRVAELFIQDINRSSKTRFTAVRFGNVLGSRGSVIPVFKKQIEAGGPVTVTHPEMVRFFMTIPEAVQLVIQAGALTRGGEIFILDMGKPVKIVDLAHDLIRLSGFEPYKDIDIKFTGVRPGEKLFEELLTGEEGTSATKHDRIFVGKTNDVSLVDLEFQLKKMQNIVFGEPNDSSIHRLKIIIKQLVPTYSEYTSQELLLAKNEAYQASLEVLAGVEKNSVVVRERDGRKY